MNHSWYSITAITTASGPSLLAASYMALGSFLVHLDYKYIRAAFVTFAGYKFPLSPSNYLKNLVPWNELSRNFIKFTLRRSRCRPLPVSIKPPIHLHFEPSHSNYEQATSPVAERRRLHHLAPSQESRLDILRDIRQNKSYPASGTPSCQVSMSCLADIWAPKPPLLFSIPTS